MSPDERRKYDEAFHSEALRVAAESRGTQAAGRALGISPKLLYRWQQAQLVAEVGTASHDLKESIKKCEAVKGQPPAVLTWEPI